MDASVDLNNNLARLLQEFHQAVDCDATATQRMANPSPRASQIATGIAPLTSKIGEAAIKRVINVSDKDI